MLNETERGKRGEDRGGKEGEGGEGWSRENKTVKSYTKT